MMLDVDSDADAYVGWTYADHDHEDDGNDDVSDVLLTNSVIHQSSYPKP